jgi:PAS domain S-box-containing protein
MANRPAPSSRSTPFSGALRYPADWLIGSLRARLVLVVSAALLPLLVVFLTATYQISQFYAQTVTTNALSAAEALANEHRIFVSHLDNVLRLTRSTPEFAARAEDCNALLERTRIVYGAISSLNRLGAEGEIECGSPTPAAAARVRLIHSASLFASLFEQDQLLVVPTTRGAVSNQPVLIAARPAGAPDASGRYPYAITAGVDLMAIGRAISNRAERLGVSDFIVMDAEGRTLFYRPRADAAAIPPERLEALGKHFLSARATGSGDVVLPDGSQRLFGIAPIPNTAVPAFVVAIKATPLQSGRGQSMAIAASVIAIAMLAFVPAVSGWAGRRFFLRPIERLHSVMMRFRNGDDGARVGGPYTNSELDELARTFDLLADRVQGREAELTAMVEHNRMLREAIEVSPAGIAVTDARHPENIVVYANPSYERITGYAIEEIVGRNPNLLRGPETDTVLVEAIKRGVRAGKPMRGELLHYRKDGSTFWNELQTTPVFDGEGRLHRMLITIGDVSERRRMQAEIESQSRRTSLVLESTSDGIYMLDHQWRFLYFNKRALKIFAHTGTLGMEEAAQGLIGASIWQMWPSLFGSSIWEAYHRAVNERQPQHFDFYFDASGQWFAISAYPTAEGLSVFFRDVTDERAQEARLIEAMRQAEAANRSKSEFLAVMSHELRTPLNAVIGFSEMLTAGLGGPLSERQKEYLGHITTSGRHLVKLVSDILDVSRLEIDKLKLDEETVDLSGVLHESLRLSNARDVDVVTSLSIEPNLPLVWGDAGRLKQVFVNLLTNAQKFTPAPGRIDVTARRDETGGITVAVKDTGIGMSKTDAARVLQPFQQAEGAYARKYGGAGLGLTIVNHLVKLHGAALTIDSAREMGTTVTIRFPAERLRDRKTAAAKQRA